MPRMKELPSVIQKKQKRIAALEQELAALKQELADAKAMLSGRFTTMPRAEGVRTRPIRDGSAVGVALKALRTSGQPMHIDSLVKFITMNFDKEFEKATLVSGLSRYVKAGDTFTRPRPSIYGLLEFEGKERAH